MKMIERIDAQSQDTLFGIAALVQSVPAMVWGYSLLVITVIALGLVWLFWSLLTLILTMIGILLALLVGTLLVRFYVRLAFSAMKGVHTASMMSLEKQKAMEQVNKARLSNQVMQTKIDMLRLKPEMMKYAVSQGFNVEYDDLKVFDWKSSMHALQGPQSVHQLDMPAIILPAKTEMVEIARRHDFSKDSLFLALGASGDVTTTIGGYLHCANDGNTGSGKTSNWRGQLVQFIRSNVDCLLLNPNFALVTKDGDDWKPLAKALEKQGPFELGLPRVVTKLENIGYVLDYMANTEVDRRFAMMREGDFSYKPLYLYIDEWPEIALKCKGANENLGTLLRRGRAVELCVSVNSQGFLKEDTELKGSARENFATAFFLGGSTYSGAKLLDITQRELEDMLRACREPIGKGVALLRNNACMPTPEVVRLPYADNDFLYYMLGRDDNFRLPPENVVEAATSPVNDDLDRVYDACSQLKEEGKKVSAREVERLTGINRTTANRLIGVLESQGTKVR